MRFRPEQHLRRQSDIRAVRELGRRIDCRAFTVWWKRRAETVPAPSPASDVPASSKVMPRVCVIASGAAVGNAIQRNRAKRRLREVFRQQQASVPPDCDLLLIARSAATNVPLPDLEKKFMEACRAIPAAPSATS